MKIIFFPLTLFRGLSSKEDEGRSPRDPEGKEDESAKEGVQLIAGKLDTFLKNQGIETVQTETYDEDLHEVVTVIGEGKNVIDVISKGYTLAGKPFRYPKIVLG